MVEFDNFDLDLRFNYEGRNLRNYRMVLCCSQQTMEKLVDYSLDAICQHYMDEDNSCMDDWEVDFRKAIIKAAGRGAIDTLGKYDLVFVLNCEEETVEEMEAQSE